MGSQVGGARGRLVGCWRARRVCRPGDWEVQGMLRVR